MAESLIDSLGLLKDPDASQPCGPNLEYDPVFLQLEQALQGKPEIQYGDTLTPAVPPDWKVITALCADLLARSYDLRVAVPHTRALLHVDGIGGFARGLGFLCLLLEECWDSVHPQLDPEDDNDPTERVNTLATLVAPSAVLSDFAAATLVQSRAHGRFNLRDIDAAMLDPAGSSGGQGASNDAAAKPSLTIIETAIAEADAGWMDAVLPALADALAHAKRIEMVLTEKVGVSHSLDMAPLTKMLKRAHGFLSERVASVGPAAQDALAPANEANAEAAPRAAHASQPAQAARRGDDISSREDVVRTIEKLCAYYARHEPSSPVPLLLERAKRLVPKNFFEIMEDLAPDGIAQLTVVSGPREQGRGG